MADNFNLRSFLSENKLTKNAKLINEQQELSYPYGEFGQGVKDILRDQADIIEDAPDVVFEMIDELIAEYDLDPSEGQVGVHAMEAKLLELAKIAKTMDTESFGEYAYNELSDPSLFQGEAGLGEAKKEETWEEGTEQVAESTLSAKEQALVEMVQAALSDGYGDDNVIKHLSPEEREEKLATAPKYTEAADEEMVQENPLPKYKNIDELMSNIEHGTNEAAHKYKMDRMKEVAEALEAKVSSLEEGENAEHIDQKVVKQMRKDILALRKAEEKLRKEFEKKFASKKEAKEDK
jgi:hypothetical protein